MQLAVVHRDLDRALAVLRDFYNQGLTAEEQASADLVVDFTAEETQCPACLTTFSPAAIGSPGAERCPDCGLFLGA